MAETGYTALAARRKAQVAACAFSALSATLYPPDWKSAEEIRAGAREHLSEGLMLERRDSAYLVGRKHGIWWKWKVQSFSVEAVLVYAHKSHGRRASLFTDYTFAVWDGEVLVPFAKAYSGLTDSETREVDSFIRRNTLEKLDRFAR